MRKFNFLDDEKVNREKEKSKLVIAHLYFINIFFAHLYSNVSSDLLNYQDSRCTTSSTSSSATERSFEKLSMLPLKTSVSAGHSALQNSWYPEWKKKDKALVDFVLIDFKNDTCDREEDFAAI